MQLFGNYPIGQLIQAFQGHFSGTQNSKSSEDKIIKYDWYDLHIVVNLASKVIKVYRIVNSGGSTAYEPLIMLTGSGFSE